MKQQQTVKICKGFKKAIECIAPGSALDIIETADSPSVYINEHEKEAAINFSINHLIHPGICIIIMELHNLMLAEADNVSLRP